MMYPGIAGNKKQVPPFTICFRCGICCSDHQAILSLAEAQRIADKLGITPDDFRNRYTDKRWPGIKNLLLRKRNGDCVFLERVKGSKVTRCQIHAFRPLSCIDWISSSYQRECQKGLARNWGLSVTLAGSVEGTSERVQEFCRLLESLTTCNSQEINCLPPQHVMICKPEKAG
jgi:Fe-S-cluster containining protein